jgi:threonine dehydrogenase-like Zn-dependent dehydrogenase
VEYVGPKAQKTALGETLKVGDRVMANEVRRYPDNCASWGGQVAYSVKNASTAGAVFDMAAKIPDGVSFQEASVAYLASVAKKGVDKVGIHPGETVVVIGMGAVGLSALQLVKLAGANVIAVDVSEWRVNRVAKFADHTICADGRDAWQQVSEITHGRMADVVIEASGNSTVVDSVCLYIRDGGGTPDDDGGRIHLQGDYPDPISLTQYSQWFNRNLRISTSCALAPGNKEFVLNLIREKKFDATVLWDKEITPEQVPDEYAELEANRSIRMKTLVKWE